MPTRAIPTITNEREMKSFLKNYQQALKSTVRGAITPIAPYNFTAKNQRGGILLSWSALTPLTGSPTNIDSQKNKISGADGYEIQRSATGDFSPGKYISIPLRDPSQNSYFDAVGGATQTYSYRIRATNGTSRTPYSAHGLFTGVVKHTSIDSSDNATVPTTVRDNFTNSSTQARARLWKNGVNSPFQ